MVNGDSPSIGANLTLYALNINLPIDLPANGTVRVAALAVYVCPSDQNTGAFTINSQIVSGPVECQSTSYAGNGGTASASKPNGLFLLNKSVKSRDVKDGASNTFAAGERGCFVVQNAWPGALGDGRGGAEVLAYIATSGPNPQSPNPSSFCGPHNGLTQFLMGDGSVHPIKATINPAVYQALATRNGGEVIDQGAY